MSSRQSNEIAFAAARAILDAAQPLSLQVEGKAVQIAASREAPGSWPKLANGRPLDTLDEATVGSWPAPVLLQCKWDDGSVALELRLTIWRQSGDYEGHLALQIVTLPANREIVWINLTKRVDDALQEGKATCSIPANFALWARSGERSARPLTDALTMAATRAGLASLAPTQFHAFDVDVALPAGNVLPSPQQAFHNLVQTALLKLPFVTRGETNGVQGNPPFSIDGARRAAEDINRGGIPAFNRGSIPDTLDRGGVPAFNRGGIPATGKPPEPALTAHPAALEPPISTQPEPPPPPVASQEDISYGFIGFQDFGPFTYFGWSEMARINVIVGRNDTGKSHLLKLMYAIARGVEDFTSSVASDRSPWPKILAEKLVWTFEPEAGKLGLLVRRGGDARSTLSVHAILCNEEYSFSFGPGATSDPATFGNVPSEILPQPNLHAVYLPPKEVLTSQNVILHARERRMFGFDDTYVDLVRALRPEPLVGALPDEFQRVLDDLDKLLGGRIVTREGKLTFERSGESFGMSQTAEGIKKIGILARLIQNGELRRPSLLFIDEPEVNLHPRAIRELVHMLFALGRAGVQIFAATHSYFVLKEMEIMARSRREPVKLCSLSRGADGVTATFADLIHGLPETGISEEALAQYDDDVKLTWSEGA